MKKRILRYGVHIDDSLFTDASSSIYIRRIWKMPLYTYELEL